MTKTVAVDMEALSQALEAWQQGAPIPGYYEDAFDILKASLSTPSPEIPESSASVLGPGTDDLRPSKGARSAGESAPDRALLVEVLGVLEPFAAISARFSGPVVEICDPHFKNPSPNIQPISSDKLRAAATLAAKIRDQLGDREPPSVPAVLAAPIDAGDITTVTGGKPRFDYRPKPQPKVKGFDPVTGKPLYGD